MKFNPVLALDGYKVGHVFQYPEGTQEVYSNFTPRSNARAPSCSGSDGKYVWFGIQAFIKEWLVDNFNEGFFNRPKEEVVAEYQRRVDNYLGVGAVTSEHIAALHDLGFLPLQIKALPEGVAVDPKTPVFTVKNTLPEFYWLTNAIETLASAELWKPATSASTARQYHILILKYAVMTGSPLDFIYWQGHDFSLRGMSGIHDGASSGAGHLLYFLGTDTLPAIEYVEEYYDGKKTFVGGSVPATEHSVMCAGGEDDEVETIRRIIQDVYPSGVVSVVSDTWDYWDVITNKARILKDVILNRQPNALGLAKTVFRPDSGDPVEILAGLRVGDLGYESLDQARENYYEFDNYGVDVYKIGGKYYKVELEYEGWPGCTDELVVGIESFTEVPEHVVKGSVEVLWDIFGGTVTDKGYKVLNQRVGLIYGDSITLERAEKILSRLEEKGFASCNVVFGIGSYTYQYVTRDSYGVAIKGTSAVVNGVRRDLFKNPKTDDGTKKSARGLIRVEQEGDKFVVYDQQTEEQEEKGALRLVFKDGVRYNVEDFETIRKRTGFWG